MPRGFVYWVLVGAGVSVLGAFLDELTDDEAWALAQMVKVLTWDHFRRLSANESERQNMDSATIELRRALAEARFDPR